VALEPSAGRPRIVGDKGPAGGNASKAQKVELELSDGTRCLAVAKFVTDMNGAVIIENGARGAAAEIVASQLAKALGAPGPTMEPAVLEPGVTIRLRDGLVPAPGLAVASRFFDPVTNVIDASLAGDVPTLDAVHVILLDSLTQPSDRGSHNLLRVGLPPRVVSIDYATALQADFTGTALAEVRVNALIEARALAETATFRKELDELPTKLEDATIDRAIAAIPRQFVPSDEERDHLRQALVDRRNVLPTLLRQRYPQLVSP
jgi:hypothetical protein